MHLSLCIRLSGSHGERRSAHPTPPEPLDPEAGKEELLSALLATDLVGRTDQTRQSPNRRTFPVEAAVLLHEPSAAPTAASSFCAWVCAVTGANALPPCSCALPRSPFQLWRSLPTTKKILRPSPGNRANPASNQTYFQRSNDVFGLNALGR